MDIVEVSPAQIVSGALENRTVSPEAKEIVEQVRAACKASGKKAAASNYARNLRNYFAWAESQGYTIHTLPADSVERFLAALQLAGQSDSTIYVTRSHIKGALREAHTRLGLDLGHIEYATGKPQAVKAKERQKAKEARQYAKEAKAASQQQALRAAHQVLNGPAYAPPIATPSYTPPVATPAPQHPAYYPSPDESHEAAPMSASTLNPSAPPADTGAAQPPAAAPAPQVIVLQQPVAAGASGGRSTIANPAPIARAVAANVPGARGITINNHVFTGAFVKVAYIADGANPFTPPGTEVYLTTLPASQLAPLGDLGGFMVQNVVPTMRLAPNTTQVQFIFYELNDRRQPTGRRDELVVGIPLSGNTVAASAPYAFAGVPGYTPQPQSAQDSATAYLLKKLDEEAADAKKRAEDYESKLREAKDAQTSFMLMQAFQKEQDLRKELEERRDREVARLSAPVPVAAPPPAMPLLPPMPMFDPPKPDTSMADMVKALSEQQSKMMEVMATSMRPAPLPPQKDTAEWLVPFISQMNQQAQAQAQANQQMLLSVMQANQQFMQAMLTRENPVEKMLMLQLQEVKAAATAPKEDELESFADKLQKMKMVSDMIGGGSNAGSLLTELLANADTIGAGAAKVIEAAKGGSQSLGAAPTKAVAQERAQLTGAPATPKLPAPSTNGEFPPPSDAIKAAHKTLVEATEKRDEEAVAPAVIFFLKELVTAQEPYASMGRRLLTAFQQAEDEGELYTLAKNLWIVVGEKPLRPQAKYVARILAEYYSSMHQAIFNEPRTLPEDSELPDEEGESDGEADESDDAAGDVVKAGSAGEAA